MTEEKILMQEEKILKNSGVPDINPATWEVEVGELGFKASSDKRGRPNLKDTCAEELHV
jgi:hypothetical protein